MTTVTGEMLRALVESSGFKVQDIAKAMGNKSAKGSQTTLSHNMSRGCSLMYYNRVKTTIEHMKEDHAGPDWDEIIDFVEDTFSDIHMEQGLKSFGLTDKDITYIANVVEDIMYARIASHK